MAANASGLLKDFRLPDNFLAGPAPNPTVNRIDFSKTKIPRYEGLYAVVLDGIMNLAECDMLIRAAETRTNGKWERALINAGGDRQVLMEDTRKCGRIIWDEQEVVDKIWARCAPLLLELQTLDAGKWPLALGMRGKKGWTMTRLNDRMRLLKYTGGEYFKGESQNLCALGILN